MITVMLLTVNFFNKRTIFVLVLNLAKRRLQDNFFLKFFTYFILSCNADEFFLPLCKISLAGNQIL